MKRAKRIATIPPYLFAEIDKKKQALQQRGVDIISLGIGDPDLPTPAHVVEALHREAADPATHRYPDYEGAPEFRQAVATYYRRRFGVELDPDKEVMALIGSKEGLAHIIWAFVDPGDLVLVPDPAYPVYRTHTLLAGGTPVYLPLRAENGFLPNLDEVDAEVAKRAKILFLNYPNNPTAGVATVEFFQRAVEFCRRYEILLCHDAAYCEMTFDGYRAPSVLEVPGAMDVAVEFYSLSKPFNMTGWRIAAAVGNSEALRALGIIKTNTDSGQFTAVQRAGIAALGDRAESFIADMNRIYRRRQDIAVAGLTKVGLAVERPAGSFYLWVPVPDGYTDSEFTSLLLEKAGVVVVPGTGYGASGAGYIRIALTISEERLQEACDRILQTVKL
ncbi:MAG TPA: LL-diaminopimelate aminotransferase [Firmicutes bacterium]|nr:LL-diaminopimelate aminotransferase [Bacillota bacterium]